MRDRSTPAASPPRDGLRRSRRPESRAGDGGAPRAPLDRQTVILGLVVVLGGLMAMLDTTMVNVALDSLGRDLHASLSSAQWVVTGYLLAVGLAMPLTSWAIDRVGAKRMWMISVTMFVVGSALSGISWSMPSLIVFRLFQGAGGGMLLPVGQAILARAAGPERIGRVMSLLGVPMLLGPVAGPIIGGVLVQDVGWHWIFFINLPIGIAALLAAARVMPASEVRAHLRLDWLGLLLVSVGLASLIYGLSQADTAGGFASPQVYGWMAGGAVLLAAFVAHSLRMGAAALIDMRIFRDRNLSAASATVLLLGFGMFGVMLILPLYYQVVRGASALEAGLLLAPQGFGAAVAMPLAGWVTDRLGARWVVMPGIALALGGTFVYTQVGANTSEVLLAGALVVRGFGLGSTTMPAIASAYTSLRSALVPQASSTINIVRQVGGSFGTAVLAVVLVSQLPALAAGEGLGGITAVPPALHAHMAPVLASAFAQTFWVAFALTAAVTLPAAFLPSRPVAEAQRAAGLEV